MTSSARGTHLTAVAAADPIDCVCGLSGGCSCAPAERALRFIAWGGHHAPLTAEQRAECFGEIHAVGCVDSAVYELATDDELAHAVLDAWSFAAGEGSPL